MVRVDRTGFAPLAVGVSKRKDNGKEDETLIVLAHPDVNLGVGGINVIGSWFKYSKKNLGGKKTNPLDDIHVDEWPLEFTELLTVLTRLVSLEADQAEVLEQILAGALVTKDELAAVGVKWPESRDDHKPRREVAADTLDIFGDVGD